MFEIEGNEIERIANDYGVSVKTVKIYAEILKNSGLIKDDDTYAKALELAISTCSSVTTSINDPLEPEQRFIQRKKALFIALNVMGLGDNEVEIQADIESMIEAYEEQQKDNSHGSK